MKDEFGDDYLRLHGFPDKPVRSLIKRKKMEYIPSIQEITTENLSKYEFPTSFFDSDVRLDKKLASETENRTLMYFNPKSLVEFCNCERILLDGTFPKTIYRQLLVFNTLKGKRICSPVKGCIP